MEYLECDRCGRVYIDKESVEMAKRDKSKWEELVRRNGDEPRGICSCPIMTCDGELILKERR